MVSFADELEKISCYRCADRVRNLLAANVAAGAIGGGLLGHAHGKRKVAVDLTPRGHLMMGAALAAGAVPGYAVGRMIAHKDRRDKERRRKEKTAEKWHDTAELAGLGILAAPHAYNLVTGKKASHKTERNTELVGLGTLMSPYIHKMVKKASKRKQAMLPFGRMVVRSPLAGKAVQAVTKNAPAVVGTASRRLAPNASNVTRATPTATTWADRTGAGKSWATNPNALSVPGWT
jgi:hypothetical protein